MCIRRDFSRCLDHSAKTNQEEKKYQNYLPDGFKTLQLWRCIGLFVSTGKKLSLGFRSSPNSHLVPTWNELVASVQLSWRSYLLECRVLKVTCVIKKIDFVDSILDFRRVNSYFLEGLQYQLVWSSWFYNIL